ncbi:hypothetical protein [Pontibacter sp. H249]|uniref:hypothetical protein n=1 Tax=Pontibacter sp. H249 TaxID=3133420 RepID=UPI0030BB584B
MIFEAFYAVTGILLSISSPILALIILFVLTAPTGIVFSNLLSREKLPYEKALIAGMITNYTFSFGLFLPIFIVGRASMSLYSVVGITFFTILFGFILSALAAVLNDKIYPERKILN